MSPHPLLSYLLSVAILATLTTGYEFDTAETFTFSPSSSTINFDSVAWSPHTTNLILGGSIGEMNNQGVGFTTATWNSTKSIQSTKSFSITPTGYDGCANFNSGFLDDSSYKSSFYLTFTCQSTAGQKPYVYFVAQVDGDGSGKYLAMTANPGVGLQSPQNFESAFMNSKIVVLLKLSSGTQIVAVTGSLAVSYQLTANSGSLTLSKVAAQEGSDAFVILGSSSSATYVATFDTDGTVKQQKMVTMSNENVESLAVGESGIQICSKDGTNKTAQSLILNASTLAVVTVENKSYKDDTFVYCSASGSKFAFNIGTVNTPTWLLNSTGKQTGSFETTSLGGFFFTNNAFLLVDNGAYALYGTNASNTSGALLPAFVAIEMTGDGDGFADVTTSFATGTSPSIVDGTVKWTSATTVSDVTVTTSQTKFTTAKTSTNKSLAKDDGRGGNGSGYLMTSLLVFFVVCLY